MNLLQGEVKNSDEEIKSSDEDIMFRTGRASVRELCCHYRADTLGEPMLEFMYEAFKKTLAWTLLIKTIPTWPKYLA